MGVVEPTLLAPLGAFGVDGVRGAMRGCILLELLGVRGATQCCGVEGWGVDGWEVES